MTANNQQLELLGKIASYTELLVKDPRSTIFVSLAETYRKMGLLEDAQQIINKGLEYHPDFAPAHIVLGRIECQLEQFEASRNSFSKALQIDPDSLAALVGFARLHLILEEPEDARQLLLRARKLSPADSVINKMLLELPPPVVEKPEPVVSKPAKPEKGLSSLASTTLADLYYKQGFTDKALQLYQQLLAEQPDNKILQDKIALINGDSSPAEEPHPLSENEKTLQVLNRWLGNVHTIKAQRATYV